MAKNKSGLHISEQRLEEMMKVFGDIKKGPCINEVSHQYTYTINNNGLMVSVTVYFRGDKTITCVAQGSGEARKKSDEIVAYIKDNAQYKNVSSGTFTCECTNDRFNNLKNYLCQLNGVELTKDEDKGQNGHILQFNSNIGDKITLTFWKTKSKMLFQGYLMLLHVEVKSFISAYGYVKTELDESDESKKSANDLIVKNMIQQYMPKSYSNLDPLLKDYIYDSIVQVVGKNDLREYSAWTFPILKALEGRIKQILAYNNVRINDKKGFKVKVPGSKDYQTIFLYDGTDYSLDTSIINIKDVNTLKALTECYAYLCKNRNTTFHVSQVLNFTRKIGTQEEAETIIYESCKLIERSYTLIGK